MSDPLLCQTTPKPQWGHLTFGSQWMVSMEPSFTEKVSKTPSWWGTSSQLHIKLLGRTSSIIIQRALVKTCSTYPKPGKTFLFPSYNECCNRPVSPFTLPASKFRSQFCSITLHICSPSLLLYCMVFVFYQDRMVLCLWVLMFYYNLLRSLQIFLEIDVI